MLEMAANMFNTLEEQEEIPSPSMVNRNENFDYDIITPTYDGEIFKDGSIELNKKMDGKEEEEECVIREFSKLLEREEVKEEMTQIQEEMKESPTLDDQPSFAPHPEVIQSLLDLHPLIIHTSASEPSEKGTNLIHVFLSFPIPSLDFPSRTRVKWSKNDKGNQIMMD